MKQLILIIIAIVLFINAFSQTVIPAGDVNGTWTEANSPYLITGDILIPAGSTLNIEPNVKVEFQGFYKLAVEGQLLAIGEKDNLVTFTINDTTGYSNENITNGGWHGIRFENNTSNDSSKIVYCKIEYQKAVNGYEYSCGIISSYFSKLIISHSIFYNNSYGIDVSNINYISIHDNIITNNKQMGLHLFEVKNAHITNNLICNNSLGGIRITAWSTCYDIILSNNTICNNYPNQVYIDELYTDVLFYNTILWGSDNENVVISSNATCSFYNCDIQNGINSLTTDIQFYENNIETDPEFLYPTQGVGWEYDATNTNWKLNETSPCIDAGISDTTGLNLNLSENDLVGNSRIYNNIIDIGAYEYPGYIGVNEIKNTDYINVYPNPANETVTVLAIFNKSININIEIISQNGSVIYKENFVNKDYINQQINISKYEKGIYFLKIISEKNEYTKKIIIQ